MSRCGWWLSPSLRYYVDHGGIASDQCGNSGQRWGDEFAASLCWRHADISVEDIAGWACPLTEQYYDLRIAEIAAAEGAAEMEIACMWPVRTNLECSRWAQYFDIANGAFFCWQHIERSITSRKCQEAFAPFAWQTHPDILPIGWAKRPMDEQVLRDKRRAFRRHWAAMCAAEERHQLEWLARGRNNLRQVTRLVRNPAELLRLQNMESAQAKSSPSLVQR